MMESELVKLAQKVSMVRVSASALGEGGVASTLQMALDELLARIDVERESLAQVVPEVEEEGEL